MNILICSVGRRVQLISNFRKELNKVNGKVIAVDCDSTAPALYHADQYEIVPRIDHPEYVNRIKQICEKYNIKGILSLIDPELPLLASLKEEFRANGIKIIIPDKRVVDICYDKFETAQFLQQHGLPSVPTYKDITLVLRDLNNGKLDFPLIVKPKNGSGSIGVKKVTNLTELENCLNEQNHTAIIQPFMAGNEYCVECYIDLFNKGITTLFSKRKLNMRAGETDKSIAIKDPILYELTISLVQALNPEGPIDIDFFQTEQGYCVSEINPRFGGGYPYAYEMGHNFIEKLINNLQGIENPAADLYVDQYEEGKTMVRYDHFVVL